MTQYKNALFLSIIAPVIALTGCSHSKKIFDLRQGRDQSDVIYSEFYDPIPKKILVEHNVTDALQPNVTKRFNGALSKYLNKYKIEYRIIDKNNHDDNNDEKKNIDDFKPDSVLNILSTSGVESYKACGWQTTGTTFYHQSVYSCSMVYYQDFSMNFHSIVENKDVWKASFRMVQKPTFLMLSAGWHPGALLASETIKSLVHHDIIKKPPKKAHRKHASRHSNATP